MQNTREFTNKILVTIGFDDARAEFNEETKRVSLHVNDPAVNSSNIMMVMDAFAKVLRAVAKKHDEGPITVDLNNYFRDKEKLVIELAKAAAKKSAITKTDVVLPPMNPFERHLVHEELSVRPDVKTESTGAGNSRRVVIKYIG